MERKLTKIYKEAQKELTEKWNAYMERGEDRLSALYNAAVDKGGDYDAVKKYEDAVRNYTLANDHYKAMIAETTEKLAHVNDIALAYVNDELPSIYAINYDQAKETADQVGVSFTLVNESVVKRMVKDGDIKLPKKKMDIPKDQRWNTKKLNSAVLQGILQGESMQKIATRILPIVDNNRKAAIRNARTMVTGAENRGRLDSYKSLEKEGLVLHKVWMATPDGRTRDWHIDMDGQSVPIKDYFIDGLGNELEYPGDPGGAPESVYNCRCTMVTEVMGFKRSDGSVKEVTVRDKDDLHDEQMAKEIERRKKAETPTRTVVNGTDISQTWVRRPDKFDFEIDDVINAQGFDGLPRVVSAEEFDKAVSKNSFIAQRVYSAPDKETLDAYQEQLYNGKWYVDCGKGGALYGQGMYATAGLNGNVTEEMKDANRFYSIRFGGDRAVKIEDFTLSKDAKIIEHSELNDDFMRAKFNGETAIEDIGSYGVVKGYDAIIVKGEGVFNTDEIIILNRTKLIIKGK